MKMQRVAFCILLEGMPMITEHRHAAKALKLAAAAEAEAGGGTRSTIVAKQASGQDGSAKAVAATRKPAHVEGVSSPLRPCMLVYINKYNCVCFDRYRWQ